ncbi:MAG: diacylglycerol kinase family protein [Gammaproteobacteria bacterium]
MDKKDTFTLRKRFASTRFAYAGIFTLIREEHNARIHLFATVLVIALAIVFDLTAEQWLSLVISTGLVWMAEGFNTAIELLCNLVNPGQHPQVKKIKDVAAAAVLITAIMAVVVGLIIFVPQLIQLVS